ncbi:hypothetical protein ACFOKI_01355 [Sphingomonas qilianensis]|uniref:Uncharacterized protein n=1 Tax=Sphingomonas qilianensis TaxID=1736690 RepID=A0ABU9XU47_9SPHN
MAKKIVSPQGVIINADREPDARNPHSWLVLVGDSPDREGTRILYGVLRPTFRGWGNTAAAFAKAKVQPVPDKGGDPWAMTATRCEVLLPGDSDDRLLSPQALMETHDQEQPPGKPVILTYVTITFPTARLHQQYELVRAFAMSALVRAYGVGVLMVQHAPHRAASSNLPHVHLLIGRVVGSLGLKEYVPILCGDKGRDVIVAAFREFEASWTG